jgi:hypothetical protein
MFLPDRIAGVEEKQSLTDIMKQRDNAQRYWVMARVARTQIETTEPLASVKAAAQTPADIRTIDMRLPANGRPAFAHEIANG